MRRHTTLCTVNATARTPQKRGNGRDEEAKRQPWDSRGIPKEHANRDNTAHYGAHGSFLIHSHGGLRQA